MGIFDRTLVILTAITISIIIYVSVNDMADSTDEDNIEDAIRLENGGILPDTEAMTSTGNTIGYVTVYHKGNEYTCFYYTRQMGCVKE